MKSFRQMTEDKTIRRADAMKIQLEDLHFEEGFNLRDMSPDAVDEDGQTFEEGIAELAAYIKAGGYVPPLEVRPRAEGGVYIVEGHRRTLAYRKLDAAGELPRTPRKDDPKVLEAWIPITAFEGNDADRVLRVMTSQQNKKLSAMAIAEGYRRLKAFGWTEAQIAAKRGMSVAHVKRQLVLSTDANSDVQALVRENKVSASVAIDTVQTHGDGAGQVLKDALATLPEGKKVTAKALRSTPLVRNVKVSVELWDRIKASFAVLSAGTEPTEEQWAEADALVKEMEGV